MFPQSNTGNIGQTGFYLDFNVENRDLWVRPDYGGMLEFDPGTTGRLIDGALYMGVHVVAATANYVKPFFGADAALDWVNWAPASAGTTYVGPMFGGLVSAGLEIRTTEREKATALRLSTSWRIMLGTVGPIQGADLSAWMFCAGLTF